MNQDTWKGIVHARLLLLAAVDQLIEHPDAAASVHVREAADALLQAVEALAVKPPGQHDLRVRLPELERPLDLVKAVREVLNVDLTTALSLVKSRAVITVPDSKALEWLTSLGAAEAVE